MIPAEKISDEEFERHALRRELGVDGLACFLLPELDAGLYGECQAALLNFEELITSEFGTRYALAEQLAVSLQFTKLIPSKRRRPQRRSQLPRKVSKNTSKRSAPGCLRPR